MAIVICAATGRIKEAFSGSRPSYDPADIVLEVPEIPRDFTTKWWDGANGLRDATAPEQAVYQQAVQTSLEKTGFDDDKMLMALARWTAGKLGVAPATARTEILTIYRSL